MFTNCGVAECVSLPLRSWGPPVARVNDPWLQTRSSPPVMCGLSLLMPCQLLGSLQCAPISDASFPLLQLSLTALLRVPRPHARHVSSVPRCGVGRAQVQGPWRGNHATSSPQTSSAISISCSSGKQDLGIVVEEQILCELVGVIHGP